MTDEPDKISFIKGAIRENDDGTETVIDSEEVDAVPVDELEDLADDLEQSEEHMAAQDVHEWADGLREAREKVEALIDEYRRDADE